ncbi:MAG: hypothetical protein AB8B55_01480 [Mariniblastus sp.]
MSNSPEKPNEPETDQSDIDQQISRWIDCESEPDSSLAPVADHSVAEQLLVSSMLQTLFESDDVSEARVQSALQKFDQVDTENQSQVLATEKPSPNFNWRMRRVAASLAALLLVAVCIWQAITPASAEAAIQKVIRSIEGQVVRVYQGTVTGRWLGTDMELRCKLRTLSSDKYAVEMENSLIQPKAFGSDGTNRWFVSGRRVWNSGVETNALRDFLLDKITLRNLQINKLLTEIPNNYELKFLKSVPLPGDNSIQCQPIEAKLIADDRGLPELVRIWAHPKTGVVAQMEILRERQSKKAPTRIVLVLLGKEPDSPTLFKAEHYSKQK